MSVSVSNCDLTELEEDELLAVSEPEDGPAFELEPEANCDTRPKKRKAKTKSKAQSAEAKRSKKALCTDALKLLEERARARWVSEEDPDSEARAARAEAREEHEPEPGLQLGVWLPSGSGSAAETEARVKAERGVELVWDAEKDDFEGLSAEMLHSALGLRCGIAARRVSNQVELRPCAPRSLQAEIVTALSGLEAFLNRWLSKRELKHVTKWTKLGQLHVACVRSAVACLAARAEMQGFRCVSAHMEQLPGFRKHERLQDFHASCQSLNAVALRKASYVRLVSCGRAVYASIADTRL